MKCRECDTPILKKDAIKCADCGATYCPKHIYQRIDGNNASITKHSPNLCATCYETRYTESRRHATRVSWTDGAPWMEERCEQIAGWQYEQIKASRDRLAAVRAAAGFFDACSDDERRAIDRRPEIRDASNAHNERVRAIAAEAEEMRRAAYDAGPETGWQMPVSVHHGPKTDTAPAADLTIEPFDIDRARRAHEHISFVPEQRARTERAAFYRFTSDVLQKAQDRARTDEQRAIMHREYSAWYRGYQQRLYAYLDAKSRTVSPMISGRANFPTRRNQKRMDIEEKRHAELMDWLAASQRRLYAAIERARTPEQITADRFARLKTEIDRAMTTAAAIDAGTMPGFTRQAFTTSISGMLKRLAANGEEETVRTALAYIREHQTAMPRPFFTDRNSVWRLV